MGDGDDLPFLFPDRKLVPYIDDENPFIRITAVRALVQIGDKSLLPHLASALKDPDKEVRIAALSAIAKFGEAEATELVMSILSDEDILVLRTTVTTRIRVRDKRLPGILVGLPDDPDTDIRRIAAFVFR